MINRAIDHSLQLRSIRYTRSQTQQVHSSNVNHFVYLLNTARIQEEFGIPINSRQSLYIFGFPFN